MENYTMNIIAPDFKHGSNIKIGSFIVIEEGVKVGDNVIVENFSMIKKGAKIGNNVLIGTYSKIGKEVVVGNNVKMTSYVEIRDNCKVGDRSTFGSRCTLSADTIVEEDVIVKYGFVATDTPVLSSKEKKTCILKKGSRYGANVVIMPAVIVGENSEIGACSQLRSNVPDNEIWYGNPAKFYKKIR